jgi:aromatic ring-cleaving dioxygenase
MSEPVSTEGIRSYHAHIYFRDALEREHALQLREQIAERFSVQLGRVHEVPVGPHAQPMYQIAFTREVFADFTAWLMLNHGTLSVLIHPNTGRSKDDHLLHAAWLGERLGVRAEVLSNDPDGAVTSSVVPNTTPR